MSVELADKILGIIASIIAILTFFGIARSVDIRRSRNKETIAKDQNPKMTLSWIGNSPKPIKINEFQIIVGALLGGFISGLAYNIAFISIFNFPIEFVAALEPGIVHAITWAFSIYFARKAENMADGILKGCIAGGIIGIIYYAYGAAPFDITLFLHATMVGILNGAVGSLVGSANSTNQGMTIGAVGGGIEGVIFGFFLGPNGPAIGLFIGIVTVGSGGAIATAVGLRDSR